MKCQRILCSFSFGGWERANNNKMQRNYNEMMAVANDCVTAIHTHLYLSSIWTNSHLIPICWPDTCSANKSTYKFLRVSDTHFSLSLISWMFSKYICVNFFSLFQWMKSRHRVHNNKIPHFPESNESRKKRKEMSARRKRMRSGRYHIGTTQHYDKGQPGLDRRIWYIKFEFA